MLELRDFPSKEKDSVISPQDLNSLMKDTMQTLKNVGFYIDEIDSIIAYSFIEKLSPEIRRDFEKSLVKSDQIPVVHDVEEQVKSSIRILELLEQVQGKKDSATKNRNVKSLILTTDKTTSKPKPTSINLDQTRSKCPLCSLEHSIRTYTTFADLDVAKRRAFADKSKLCFNCLAKNHFKKVNKVVKYVEVSIILYYIRSDQFRIDQKLETNQSRQRRT